jgi:DNA-binding transcriptional LysR family regulator
MQWFDRVGRRLRPRDLHVFLAVCEHKTMAKAAQELGVSRPVVSRSIAELEQLLQAQLFDRTPQGLVPTRYGEALLRRSFAIFDDLRQSVLEIERLKNPDGGELRIGTSDVFAAALVPTAMDSLSRRFPGLRFEVDGVTPGTMASYLRDRQGELVVTRVRPVVEPDLAVEPLYFERLRVVAKAGNPWIGRKKLTLAALLDEPWILSSFELGEDSPFVRALRAVGASPPRRCILSNSLTLRAGLLASDRYLTLLPGSVLQLGPQWRKLVAPLQITLPDWHLPVAILTLKDRILSPAGISFVEEIRKAACPLQVRTADLQTSHASE